MRCCTQTKYQLLHYANARADSQGFASPELYGWAGWVIILFNRIRKLRVQVVAENGTLATEPSSLKRQIRTKQLTTWPTPLPRKFPKLILPSLTSHYSSSTSNWLDILRERSEKRKKQRPRKSQQSLRFDFKRRISKINRSRNIETPVSSTRGKILSQFKLPSLPFVHQ